MKTKDNIPISNTARCRRLLSISSIALILVFSLCALYLFAPVIYYKPEVQRLIDGLRQFTHIPIQPDRESDLIAFVCRHHTDDGGNLFVIRPDGTNLQLISSSPSKLYYSLSWSPDGIWLAMDMKDEGYWSWSRRWTYESHHSEVYKIRFDGSVLKRLTYNRYNEDILRWSDDGRSILFDYGGLHSVSANGSEVKQINQLSRRSYSLSHNGLLLTILHNRTGDPALDYSLHQDSSGLKLLVSPDAKLRFFNRRQWSRNDEAFYYSDGYKGLQVFNMKTLLRVDIPNSGLGRASWSPNGKWLAINGSSKNRPERGEWIRISDDESPDDRYRRDLYLLNMDAGRLTTFVQDINYVRIEWSPDSEWIAFVSSLDDGQLFKIKRDGTVLQQLTDLDCRISELSWSPR